MNDHTDHLDHGDHPDLSGLLRGDVPAAEATAVDDHLRRCTECRDELADLVVGHALLSRAAATLGELPAAPRTSVPSVSSVSRRSAPVGLVRRSAPVLALAAAVAVVAVITVGALALRGGGSAPPVVTASARLVPVLSGTGTGVDTGSGEVRMRPVAAHESHMSFTVTGLPAPTGGHYYYAWLVDPATQKMLPLGQLGAGGQAEFDLDDTLLSAYSAIDVSLEDDDGDPGHSATSVLRGSYDPSSLTS